MYLFKQLYVTFTLVVCFLMVACVEDGSDIQVSTITDTSYVSRSEEQCDTSLRYAFTDEIALKEAIEGNNGDIALAGINPDSINLPGVTSFVSMMSYMPPNSDGEKITYYEALGYDSLVPNTSFAKYLNIKGEIEVGNTIAKITPVGTYVYPKTYENDFNKMLADDPEPKGQPIDSIRSIINEYVILYRTFQENPKDYILLSKGDETIYPDSYFGDPEDPDEPAIPNFISGITRSISEPNYESFETFSADRKTFFGKLIQNIIGSTKTSTVKFSDKRRIRGSLYFYNYGVYSEIGVKGWTDKKNKIGWSKTACPELRVGWNNIILKTSVPNYQKEMMASIKSEAYNPPQITYINGKGYKTATLVTPQISNNLKSKLITKGAKAVYDYIRSIDKSQSTRQEFDAAVIATQTEIYFVCPSDWTTKYEEKYYCHVFHQQWMEFSIGWGNANGFFIGTPNLQVNKVGDIKTWVNSAVQIFNQNKPQLVSGEAYICGRFEDVWKGMKILKKLD